MHWYEWSQNTNTSPVTQFDYGGTGWFAVSGDWNGDGITTPGVYDPSTGTWYLRNFNSAGSPYTTFQYGAPGDVPVVGDWDGNGTTTIGVAPPRGRVTHVVPAGYQLVRLPDYQPVRLRVRNLDANSRRLGRRRTDRRRGRGPDDDDVVPQLRGERERDIRFRLNRMEARGRRLGRRRDRFGRPLRSEHREFLSAERLRAGHLLGQLLGRSSGNQPRPVRGVDSGCRALGMTFGLIGGSVEPASESRLHREIVAVG